MKPPHLDCMFHDEGIPDAPCICEGMPESFAPVEIVEGEVVE